MWFIWPVVGAPRIGSPFTSRVKGEEALLAHFRLADISQIWFGNKNDGAVIE